MCSLVYVTKVSTDRTGLESGDHGLKTGNFRLCVFGTDGRNDGAGGWKAPQRLPFPYFALGEKIMLPGKQVKIFKAPGFAFVPVHGLCVFLDFIYTWNSILEIW